MLPFLKNRDDGVGVAKAESKERKPDDPEASYGMLDAVAEDLLAAVEKKDKGLLKEALAALCEHIQEMDREQDQSMEGTKE